MKKHITLFILTMFSSSYNMQSDLKPFTITLVDPSLDAITILEKSDIMQKTMGKKKTLFINQHNECSYITSQYVYDYHRNGKPTPPQTTLVEVSPNLKQYGRAVCMIKQESYNPLTDQFDRQTDMAIRLFSTGNLQSHYLIQTDNLTNYRLILRKIKQFYEKTEIKKSIKPHSNHLKNTPRNYIKNIPHRLYIALLSIYNRIILMCPEMAYPHAISLITEISKHPEFPSPLIKQLIEAIPATILFKAFIELIENGINLILILPFL